MYTYKDFATGKIRRTNGKFSHWSERTGPLNVRYAGFKRPRTWLWIPSYCLTPETKAAIPAPGGSNSKDEMNVIDRIKAATQRNRQDYEFLADLTGQTVAKVEADVCTPDPKQDSDGPDDGGREA